MDVTDILNALKPAADPARAAPMAAYMKHRFSFLGIPTPERRRLIKPLIRAGRGQPLNWHFMEDCWANPYRELQYVATDYLRSRQSQLDERDLPRLQGFMVRKAWWDSVDAFIGPLGHLVQRYPAVRVEIIAMAQAEDFWLRRAAITCQLLAKERTDRALLATVLNHNLGATEFFINKAIGWALRQYSKTDAAWVRAYLAEHRDGLSRLSVREASKYLD